MNLSGSRLTYYETFSERDLEPFRKRGKADGALCLPESVTQGGHGASEEEFISRARADLAEFMREVHEQRSRYEAERDGKAQQVDSFRGKREVLTNEFNGRVEALRRQKGDASPIYIQAKNGYDEAQDAFKNLAADLGRPISSFLSNRWYLVVLGILSAVEVPINQPAVSEVFAESVLTSYVLAAAIGVVLMFLAHTIGRLVRQFGHAWRRGVGAWIPNLLLLASSLALSIGMVWFLYLLRLNFFINVLHIPDPGPSGDLFLLFNLAVLLVGVIVAFFHHDPNPDFQSAAERSHRNRGEFYKVEREFERDRQVIQGQYDQRSVSMAREVERLEGEVEVAIKGLANLERHKLGFVNQVLEVLSLQLQAYQTFNIQARAERPQACLTPHPAHFGHAAIKTTIDAIRKDFKV